MNHPNCTCVECKSKEVALDQVFKDLSGMTQEEFQHALDEVKTGYKELDEIDFVPTLEQWSKKEAPYLKQNLQVTIDQYVQDKVDQESLLRLCLIMVRDWDQNRS